ncbi:MAG: DNA polymerase III subunit beta [Thermotogae bacterium]|jgi:DNA polymerase-3 subunit beta|nr:DNA polymerase III subunit beta [Thermotogota bacterium]
MAKEKKEEKKETKSSKGKKIPAKSPEERLNKSVTASVTEKFKGEVKKEAEKEDESISAFARKSLTDEIYHDLHPEASVKDLVETGHEERSEIRKKPLVRQDKVIVGENEVSVVQMNKYLKLLKDIVPTRPINPILGGIKIKFEKDKAELLATSIDDSMQIVNPKWHGDIAFVADYTAILKLFASTKAETATFIKQGENQMAIRFSNGQSSTIFIQSTEEFPEVRLLDNSKEEEISHVTEIKSDDLSTLLRSVEYAQQKDPNMKNLHGVEFELVDGKLILITVDGFRMGYLEYEVKHEKSYNFLLTMEAIHALIDSLNISKDITVEIFAFLKHVGFKIGEITLISKIVEAEFPNYKRVIPDEDTIKAVIEANAKELYDAIRSLATFYKNNDTVKLALPKAGTEMTVSATSADIGSSEAKVPIEIKSNAFDGDMKFGFNPAFLMQPLKLWSSYGYETHPENKVTLKFVDDKKPLTMMPAGSTKTFAIVMPIRL